MVRCCVCGKDWPDNIEELFRLLRENKIVIGGKGKAEEFRKELRVNIVLCIEHLPKNFRYVNLTWPVAS